MGRLRQLVLCTCLAGCIGLLIPYGPLTDTAIMAYREFIGDLFAFEGSTPNIEARSKNVPLKDLTEMITYANPEARAFAAKAIQYKADSAAISALIQALNDTRPFRDRQTREETSLAEISKASLTGLLKAQITKDPENIALLGSLFTAVERGSQLERRSVVEILGEMREPLARPLLRQISSERDMELVNAGKMAAVKMDSLGPANDKYAEITGRQVRIALGCAMMIVLLLWSVFRRLREGLQTRVILLSAIPVVLVGSFGAVIISDHLKGEVSEQRIEAAIRDRDLIALRTMNYYDHAPYPGDSYVTQYLLRNCNEEVIRCLTLLPSVQTTDDLTATTITDTRKRWILARFIASNLGTPRLASLVTSPDAEIRATVATILGKLGVRNEHITDALTRLSQDPTERVRKSAEEASKRVGGYPVWLGYAPPG